MDPRCSAYATRWLTKRGVAIQLGTTVVDVRQTAAGVKVAETSDGMTMEADLVYRCFGDGPALGFLPPALHVPVRDTMQLEGHDNVFMVGDITSNCGGHAANDQSAFCADIQGLVVARNIVRLGEGEKAGGGGSLDRFPQSVCYGRPLPTVLCISLYKYSGTMQVNGFVVNGPLAACSKWVIECLQLRMARGSAVAAWLWLNIEKAMIALACRWKLFGAQKL
mmetsp:Transcript_4608/g.12056  ORF Transcript_4608/g.12056 Transcript_4608/m.12056 type:complete len:222 (+) Transcript_4608:171-836(+)